MTLRRSDVDVSIHFGAIISNPGAEIAKGVSIGAYSLIGMAIIGEGTQIAGHVQIVSGKQQHQRDASGNLTDTGRVFQEVKIGSHCWIGAGAIIATDVGDQATVGAGSVVVKPVPAGATAVGNPARVLESKLAPVSEPPTV
jgi:acetyltransferase-like isoleucine patch superfamily enzyme